MNQPIPNGNLASLDQAQQLGLRPEEFEKIIEILGRIPTFTVSPLIRAFYPPYWT